MQARASKTTSDSQPDFEQLMRGINFRRPEAAADLSMNEIKNNFMEGLRNSEHDLEGTDEADEDLPQPLASSPLLNRENVRSHQALHFDPDEASRI